MKKKINFCLFLLMFCSINTFGQYSKPNKTLELSKEQKLKDSIDFAKFKQNHPEDFLNERLPIKLLNGGYVISGYRTAIQIKNNQVTDSVYHNFIPGMPDTTTVNPFSNVKVTDENIEVNLFSHLIMSGGKDHDSAEITPIEPDLIVNNKMGKLPVSDFNINSIAIKISINGKLLFDWKSLRNFPKQAYKVSEKFLDFHGGSMYGYIYGYTICNTAMNINDQLLIEIKTTKNNWMIDRYNITRVTASPNISALIPIDKNGKLLPKETISLNQKKTLALNLVKGN